MKNQIVQIMAVVALVVGTPAWAQHEKITVHVKGMVCDLCARGLTKGFNAFKEKSVLDDFKVELAKHTVELVVKDGASISDAEIIGVVERSSMAIDKIVR